MILVRLNIFLVHLSNAKLEQDERVLRFPVQIAAYAIYVSSRVDEFVCLDKSND